MKIIYFTFLTILTTLPAYPNTAKSLSQFKNRIFEGRLEMNTYNVPPEYIVYDNYYDNTGKCSIKVQNFNGNDSDRISMGAVEYSSFDADHRFDDGNQYPFIDYRISDLNSKSSKKRTKYKYKYNTGKYAATQLSGLVEIIQKGDALVEFKFKKKEERAVSPFVFDQRRRTVLEIDYKCVDLQEIFF